MRKMFNNKCGKKKLTLGEVKAMANKNNTPKKDEGTSVGATASITSDNDPHEAEVLNIIDSFEVNGDNDEADSTFNNCIVEMKLKKIVTKEKLQTRFQYWSSSDQKAMNSDKTCIV